MDTISEDVLAYHLHQTQVVTLFVDLYLSLDERSIRRSPFYMKSLTNPFMGIYRRNGDRQVALLRETDSDELQVVWIRSVRDLQAMDRETEKMEKELANDSTQE